MATTSQKRQAMEALVERYAASQEDAEMDLLERRDDVVADELLEVLAVLEVCQGSQLVEAVNIH